MAEESYQHRIMRFLNEMVYPSPYSLLSLRKKLSDSTWPSSSPSQSYKNRYQGFLCDRWYLPTVLHLRLFDLSSYGRLLFRRHESKIGRCSRTGSMVAPAFTSLPARSRKDQKQKRLIVCIKFAIRSYSCSRSLVGNGCIFHVISWG